MTTDLRKPLLLVRRISVRHPRTPSTMFAAQTTRIFAPARLQLRAFRPLTVRTMAAKVTDVRVVHAHAPHLSDQTACDLSAHLHLSLLMPALRDLLHAACIAPATKLGTDQSCPKCMQLHQQLVERVCDFPLH